METIKITNTNNQLTAHFNEQEFYLASRNPNQEFDTPAIFPQAAEILRDWDNKDNSDSYAGMKLTSTMRSDDPPGYPHSEGLAFDTISLENNTAYLANFKQECENYINGKGSELIDKLRAIGVDGFGIEEFCVHIDAGFIEGNRSDEYGKYRIFVFTYHIENGKMVVDQNYAL
jgi:hypothetical protein